MHDAALCTCGFAHRFKTRCAAACEVPSLCIPQLRPQLHGNLSVYCGPLAQVDGGELDSGQYQLPGSHAGQHRPIDLVLVVDTATES